jgi:CRISPR-associated protein Cmr6
LLTKLMPWKLSGTGDPVDWTNDKKTDRKPDIAPVCKAVGHPQRRDLARAWHQRRRATLSQLEKTGLCRRWTVVCATDTVLWLSAGSPVELGFCLHHVYGIPYLPGSALKGVARAYGEHLLAGRDEHAVIDLTQDELDRIFGTSKGENGSKADADSAGCVDFLDGPPANGVKMGLDIMTPHHSSYYGSPRSNWPHDSEDPTPVPFLHIETGSQFELAVVCRRSAPSPEKEVRELLTKAMELLSQGLCLLGVGAKTTSGYGILQPAR